MRYSIQHQHIAKQLRAARKKKRLSQRALSAKVGIAQSHLSKIEQGKVDLQLSSLIEIARSLDLEPVLVFRQHLSAVEALQRSSRVSKPAFQLPDDEEDV